MKNQLLTLAVILCSWNLLFSSGPVQNLTPLNSPIVVGEQVYFQSTVDYPGPDCGTTLLLDFGPNAMQQFYNFPIVINATMPFNMVVGPVVFDMPGSFNASQSFVGGNCPEPDPSNPFLLPLEILPDTPIPTLSQWGLIIVGFFLMIFGIVTLKKKEKVVTT
jgi:hypothetical protein